LIRPAYLTAFHFRVKGGSLLPPFCKEEKGEGHDDDAEQKQEDEGRQENEESDDDFGHAPSF
jgi:hypothetical protein